MPAWCTPAAARAGDRSLLSYLRASERRCTTGSTTPRPSPPRSLHRNDPATAARAAHAGRAGKPVQARALDTPLLILRSASLEARLEGCDHSNLLMVRDTSHTRRSSPCHRMLPSSLVQKIQRQTRARPVHRDQFALARQCNVGGLQVGAPEGEIGGDAVAGGTLLDDGAIRRDHRDTARDQRRHADIAGGFHRERVEHLVTAEARNRLSAPPPEEQPTAR